MLERPLRWIAIALSLVITASFVLFALDDIDRASAESRDRIVGQAPPPALADSPDRGGVGGKIDDVSGVLLRPFVGLSDQASSRWVRRGVPTLLGLLTYGFLLAYAARYAKSRA